MAEYDELTPRIRAIRFIVQNSGHHLVHCLDDLEALIIEAQNNVLQQARMALHSQATRKLERREAARIVAGFRIER